VEEKSLIAFAAFGATAAGDLGCLIRVRHLRKPNRNAA
jgi:hypothetical protein